MNALSIAVVVGLAGTLLIFRALDVRGRPRWLEAAGIERSLAGPYRSTMVHGARLARAPRSVRVAVLVSVAFVLAAAPSVYFVLREPNLDGIAVPLLPGLVLSLASTCCVAALLARATEASNAARLTGRASLFFHGVLSILALAHLIVVETEWGSQVHGCSRSLALVVFALAVAAAAQSFAVVRAATASEAIGRGAQL